MQFVDTNVILYAYDTSEGDRHRLARDLVGRLGRRRSGALSVQVLQEFYVNAVTKIAVRLSPDEARRRLRALGRWRVHTPMPGDVVAASVLSEGHQISFWDAMIIRSAAELGCEILWSEDLSSGQKIAGVEVRNPFG
ncbi:MAG: PIN domain-containing protein [Acidimicrobiia bacterium]|nr:PIN domain-containing protein [Acidimicrobiia bacterium]